MSSQVLLLRRMTALGYCDIEPDGQSVHLPSWLFFPNVEPMFQCGAFSGLAGSGKANKVGGGGAVPSSQRWPLLVASKERKEKDMLTACLSVGVMVGVVMARAVWLCRKRD